MLGSILVVLFFASVSGVHAQEKSADAKVSKQNPPRGLTSYMGRRVALPMSYHGIPWLNRPERVDEEKPIEMLEQLRLQNGIGFEIGYDRCSKGIRYDDKTSIVIAA